jgi:hypothetical protein
MLADTDHGGPLGGDAECREPGEDLHDVQLVVQVGLEPQHVPPVAGGVESLVSFAEPAQGELTRADRVGGGQVGRPDAARLVVVDRGHRAFVEHVEPHEAPVHEPGAGQVGAVAVGDVQRSGQRVRAARGVFIVDGLSARPGASRGGLAPGRVMWLRPLRAQVGC